MHWYLAIIYFPEYTLLARPVQKTNVQTRRSTRRLGVIIDSSDALQPDPASRKSLPPDADPPPNGQVHTVSCSELIIPESPRTDDQKDENDVELMVESDIERVDPMAKRADAVNPDLRVTHYPDSPGLAYPHSSPPSHPARLPTSDLQGDGVEQLNHPASSGRGEGDTMRTSGIRPSTFYGTKNQGQSDVTPQLVPASNSVLPDIEIDEDETMGNLESEPEEAIECASFPPSARSIAHELQGIQELTSILLIRCHRSTPKLSRGSADTFLWRLMTRSS